MSCPAIEFQKQYGLSEIAGDYIFPDVPKLDRRSMQERIYILSAEKGTPEHQGFLREYVSRYATNIGMPSLTKADVQPGGHHSVDFEKWAGRELEKEFKSMFARLKTLNPTLVAAIKCNSDNGYQLYNAVHGIVSGFHPDDINYYIHDYKQGSPEDHARRQIERRILQSIGATNDPTLGWIASPSTLSKIERQVKELPIVAQGYGICR